MATAFKVIPKEYRDSVSLMQLSALLAKLPGIDQASALMATGNNLALLTEAGFEVSAADASPADLLIAVRGEEAAVASAIDEAMKNLTRHADSGQQGSVAPKPRSMQMALAEVGAADIALISTPGEYAAAEALKALNLGLSVMLFSDNVSEPDELRLKRAADEKDLIVMGPDCGTAIINGLPLGFANVVRRGPIGVVGASGTGMQEVTVLIDRLGSGVSQAIGTGGRDLHSAIGGISMSKGLRDLAADPITRVIVLISKPPAADVAERILDAARRVGKPVVVNFLGADPRKISGGSVHGARTLEDAARAAVDIARGELPRQSYGNVPPSLVGLPPLGAGQRYIRGLYTGGTFCYEAALLLDERLADVYTNTPVCAEGQLEDVGRSHHHTLIDLGDDVFTRGRPHPMIDFRLRNERIVKEAEDAETAVILLDVVLGYGSNTDPAGELIPALQRAREIAAEQRRNLAFVGHVCGTEGDPQGLDLQISALSQAGMVLTQSNAQAVRLAASMVAGRAPGRD